MSSSISVAYKFTFQLYVNGLQNSVTKLNFHVNWQLFCYGIILEIEENFRKTKIYGRIIKKIKY